MRENKKQAALDYLKSIHVEYDSDPVIAYCAFIAGAEWADKTMVNRGCQWILNNMSRYIKANGFEIYINNKDMASDFRKAMLEEK